LYELSKEPTAADYKKAYSLLQIMDSTLSTESILSSLVDCENMINSETDKYLKQGNAKKSELENNRKNERTVLEAKINEISTSIANLRKELDEKNNELTNKKTELEKLDGKFTPELEKTTQTIGAVSSASKMVLSSLSQIKEGINNNLK
jgi:flagellar biosynthesis chaperone FliJ